MTMSNVNLQEAVEIVNTYNRTAGQPLVAAVTCEICSLQFASQVQDVGLARRRGLGQICPSVECKKEARRRRQRGERRPE